MGWNWSGIVCPWRHDNRATRSSTWVPKIGRRNLQSGTWTRAESIRSDCVPLRDSIDHVLRVTKCGRMAVNQMPIRSKQLNSW